MWLCLHFLALICLKDGLEPHSGFEDKLTLIPTSFSPSPDCGSKGSNPTYLDPM